MASSLNAVPAGAQDFLLPPTVAAALAEAEAKQQLAQAHQGPAASAAPPPQQLPQPAQDASGAADAFLSSLSDMLGGTQAGAAPAADAEPAPPLPTEPPPDAEEFEAEAERPVDLFKAIFEDSEEEEEVEEEEEEAQVGLGGGCHGFVMASWPGLNLRSVLALAHMCIS